LPQKRETREGEEMRLKKSFAGEAGMLGGR
jgi:hypothetical protein